MDRLTVKSVVFEGHCVLKSMCTFDDKGKIKGEGDCASCGGGCDGFCGECEIQKAFDRLAAYEDTELSPEEISIMKAQYSDTFQAHLNEMCDIKDKRIAELESENTELHKLVDTTAKDFVERLG